MYSLLHCFIYITVLCRNGIRAGDAKIFHEINCTKKRRKRTWRAILKRRTWWPRICFLYEVQNKLAPARIQNYFTHVSDIHSYNTRLHLFKVVEHSFGSLWVYVICQIMARERLQLTSWNLASEKYTDERFWLTGKTWRFRSFHGNMNDWIQP